MKQYNTFDFSNPNSIPEFKLQTQEFTCFHCGRTTKVPIRVAHINWESVAKQYENYAKEMWTECNLLLSKADVDTLLVSQLRKILEKCKKKLEL